jgi:hypothetical protein
MLSNENQLNEEFLVMVKLEDGSYALRRASEESDQDQEPLVKISFSDEAKELMLNNDAEIAKVMVNAGAQAVASYHQQRIELERKHRVLH